MRLRTNIAIALAAACGAVLPAPAQASSTQESTFQDDSALLHSGDDTRRRALDELDRLGVDTVRINVYWRLVAPSPDSTEAPEFDEFDPSAYPHASWDPYDSLVRDAEARGIRVLMTPTSGIPAWASQCNGPIELRRTCRPSPGRFYRFVAALGYRYNGLYADENQGGGALPRVGRWSIWNEPNHGGWLKPQYSRRAGRYVPEAGARYRLLAQAGERALRRTGHGADQILLGETAPIGRSGGSWLTRTRHPVSFYRDLFCIDSRGRRLRGRSAYLRRCGGLRRFHASGIAHHPYTPAAAAAPRSRPPSAADVTIGTLARLRRVIDQGARAGMLKRARPIWLTEFGFQTNPPDRYVGVSPLTQGRWMNEADWIAFRDSRVMSVSQFEWHDEADPAVFNTGIRFASGARKASFASYRLPIWVTKTRRYYRIWGQLRPAAWMSSERVRVQYRASARSGWRTLRSLSIRSRRNHVYVRSSRRAPYWRLVWTPAAGGQTLVSRTASPARR